VFYLAVLVIVAATGAFTPLLAGDPWLRALNAIACLGVILVSGIALVLHAGQEADAFRRAPRAALVLARRLRNATTRSRFLDVVETDAPGPRAGDREHGERGRRGANPLGPWARRTPSESREEGSRQRDPEQRVPPTRGGFAQLPPDPPRAGYAFPSTWVPRVSGTELATAYNGGPEMQTEEQIEPRAGQSDADEVMDAEQLDGLVEEIRQMKRNSLLCLAIDVGRLIVERLFKGDLRSHGKDHPGFRRLARHPQLPFSRSTLWRYVGVSDLVSRMPGLVRCKTLTVAHMSAVLRLEPKTQERMLKLAVKLRWSATALEQEVRRVSDAHGRKHKPSVLIAIRRLERLRAGLSDLGRVDDLAEKERDHIRRVVEDTRAWCEAVACWLAAGDGVN